jgi:transposase
LNTINRLVSDELWEVVEPHLPLAPPRSGGGRPRVPARGVFCGIIYVLKTGIPWVLLPREFDCSGVTCWRRLRDWRRAGVFGKLHRVLLNQLGRAAQIDWSRASLDSASIPAKRGQKTGPNPLDRGKPGSKRHILTDTAGIPLAGLLTAANVHDSKVFEELVDSVMPIKGKRGRPRKRPDKLHADKGYDYPRCRQTLRKRGIKARIARKGVESSERLGRWRWVVERTFSWIACYRRLVVRYERRADIHEAFLQLACCLICFRRLQNRF